MRFSTGTTCALVIVLLSGCGGDTPRAAKKDDKAKPAAQSSSSSTATPSTPVVAPTAVPVVVTPPTVPPPPRSTAATPAAAQSKAVEGKKTLHATAEEFGPDLMSGKPASKWIAMMDSGKKDDVLEALEVFRIGHAHPAAKKALPRINDLMKNADTEIAKAATDAAAAIGK